MPDDTLSPEPAELLATVNGRLRVQVAPKDGYTLFRHVGCLTERERDVTGQVTRAILESPGKAAVLDMTASFLVDAFGLGTLLLLNGAMAARGRTLAILIDGENTVLRRLRSTGVAEIIPVHTSPAQCATALARL